MNFNVKRKITPAVGIMVMVLAACGQSNPDATPTTAPIPQEAPVTIPSDPSPTPPPVKVAEPTQTSVDVSKFVQLKGDQQTAPELTGLNSWINSEPFTLEEKRAEGQVVLIDFWTYTCVNCLRTIPFLREWQEKYADRGLVILGVHTPEFEFEKIRENVVDATERFGIEWPVAQDNDFGTWRAFNNRFWPAKYLIDTNGTIRYTHFGEGEYDVTEEWIRTLLEESGQDLSDIEAGTDPGPAIDVQAANAAPGFGTTRELYAGYERNYGALLSRNQPPYVLHEEFYQQPDSEILYEDPGDHRNHFVYLEGLWRNNAEKLVHARETENYEDYIAIQFFGTSVNAVISPESEIVTPFDVRVTLDDEPLAPERAGLDIQYDDEGNSLIRVDESRMYFVISQPVFGKGELKLSSNSSDFALFAFTFGSYQNGEPVPTDGL